MPIAFAITHPKRRGAVRGREEEGDRTGPAER